MMSPALPGGRGPCNGFVSLTSGWKGSRFAVITSFLPASAAALVSASELAAGADAFEETAFVLRAAFFAGALCAPAAGEIANASASTAQTVRDDFASFIVFALRRPYLPTRRQAPPKHLPLS